jgi:hypothetical protein
MQLNPPFDMQFIWMMSLHAKIHNISVFGSVYAYTKKNLLKSHATHTHCLKEISTGLELHVHRRGIHVTAL